MARTIAQGFREFQANLEISDLQSSTVATRQSNLREAISGQLTVLDDFLTGSYRRHTLIAPLKNADIDVFVVLDSTYYKSDGQATLLDLVRRVLLKTYPNSPRVSRNGQAVTIIFSDFRADVVPGFYRSGGGYLIPDSNRGTWIGTDPKKHVELWAQSNTEHDGHLVPLIKMLKCWNRAHSSLLTSFHLETLTRQVLERVNINSYTSGARFVFDRARSIVRSGFTADAAGYSGNVSGYLDTVGKRENACERLDAAFVKARDAEGLEAQGHIQAALEKWAVVFGDFFPAYG
jgi:hypothetical protein